MSGLMLSFRKNTGIGDQIVVKVENGEEIVLTYMGIKQSIVAMRIEANDTAKIFRRTKDGESNEKP